VRTKAKKKDRKKKKEPNRIMLELKGTTIKKKKKGHETARDHMGEKKELRLAYRYKHVRLHTWWG